MLPTPTRRRAVIAATLVTALVASSAAPGRAAPVPDGAGRPAGAAARVDPTLTSALAGGGRATFLVTLRSAADLGAAGRARGKARASEVYRAKRAHADVSQAGLRTMLTARRATFTPYWITNTVAVTGDAALLAAVAARPEVAGVVADAPLPAPALAPAAAQPTVDAVEWNVDRVGAPAVWQEYGTRGEGIVVANIDTGVQHDHPALGGNYRGRLAGGGYDHHYHWYDPSGECRTAPCDATGHGTHTMGTMAGAGGIGVAPGVTWIAARGCASSACTQRSLLAAGQWILAPTDLDGRNPRPDLAPDVVNNSWGAAGFWDPFYTGIVDAWIAAGIFPAFSNGNSGPQCGTANTPAAYATSYATGAFDAGNVIAEFSSRGPSLFGDSKPDIAAPGVDIRSSVPGGGYEAAQGTSMASPHTAAAVALLWAAVPGLRRDVASTRATLDESAIDTSDTSCGGTAAKNAVFGEGRLDAHAAVRLGRQPVGALTGTVTADDAPVADHPVQVTGPKSFSVRTGADGRYRIPRLPVGTYRIAVDRYAYHPAERTVQVTEGAAGDGAVALQRLPYSVLTGVLDARDRPVAGAVVAVTGTPLSVRSDAQGRYRVEVPNGSYAVTFTPPNGCVTAAGRQVELAGEQTVDVTFAAASDRFGYTCDDAIEPYLAGTQKLPMRTTGDNFVVADLPFELPFYGAKQSRIWINTNGYATFRSSTGSGTTHNGAIPRPAPPRTSEADNALYPFWDDLSMDARSGVWTATAGDVFVIEWRDFLTYDATLGRVSVAMLLHRDGTITYRYRDLQGQRGNGSSATIGIENADGTDALAYSVNAPSVRDGAGVTFRPPAVR